MKSLKSVSLALILAGVSASPLTYADNTASAFTDDGQAAMLGAAAIRTLGTSDEGFVTVLNTELKNSGTPKDLVIGLSFETMLMTETVVRSKGGNKSEATADAVIEMRVFVDDKLAAPGEVIFDKRIQTLWAELGGVLDCADTLTVDTDGDGVPDDYDGIISFDECNLTEEEIGLILDTAAAHTFNFLAYDIGSGSHTIRAEARVSYGGQVVEGDGSVAASASLGKGTLSVWEVHGSNGSE
ncbi:hypothetical protein [Ferrimonas balearica]|uniref:hypothetical protein n=1 Tax=Ferrimonas balearica TaxID=44012 RepID=UPI001C99BEC8|nr:hypothetical protein [Ferrimonas balearica]MBY5921659.1 hypothetical protein [Ferrimonas balearica]MBY5995001.1 hypothetical protein [Ferrimonas balearica]